MRKVLLVKRIAAILTENAPWNNAFEDTVLRDIKKVIDNMVLTFERQIAHKTISNRQKYAYDLLKNLYDLLQSTEVNIRGADTKFSLYDMLAADTLITGDIEGKTDC